MEKSASSVNWTPGPWRADWDDNGQWYIEPLTITGRALRGDSGDCLESANAHLIAAAPDLYEALDNLTDVTVCIDDNGPVDSSFICDLQQRTRTALEALAKARGESLAGESNAK